MRRVISFLLAILVLVLSCCPCNDDCAVVSTITGKTVTRVADDHNSSQHADICSPFCTCACCAGIIIPDIIVLDIARPLPYFGKQEAIYIPRSLASIALPVWQPPQLV